MKLEDFRYTNCHLKSRDSIAHGFVVVEAVRNSAHLSQELRILRILVYVSGKNVGDWTKQGSEVFCRKTSG